MIIYNLREFKKITPKQYAAEKFRMQVELLKLQEDVIKNGRKIAIIFEGRDAAGKTATIQHFSQYLIPEGMEYINFGVPTKSESKNWFKRYERKMPKKGQICFFDRSWYSRALIEPTLGFCSQRQYKNFMNKVNHWEKDVIENGTEIIKFYLSIDQISQQKRLRARQESPIKYWKFSETDAQIINKYDIFKLYKEQMFEKTSSSFCPWVVINATNKRVARINAMHYLLNKLDYDEKEILNPRKWSSSIANYTFTLEDQTFENLTYKQYQLLTKYLG